MTSAITKTTAKASNTITLGDLLGQLEIDSDKWGETYTRIETTFETSVNGETELTSKMQQQIRDLLVKSKEPQHQKALNEASVDTGDGRNPSNSPKIPEEFYLEAFSSEMNRLDRRELARTQLLQWAGDLIKTKRYPVDVTPELEKMIFLLAKRIIEHNTRTFAVADYPRTPLVISDHILELLEEPIAENDRDLNAYQRRLSGSENVSLPRRFLPL